MNITEMAKHMVNSTTVNQSEVLVSNDLIEGNSFSLAVRVLNGIIIIILFTFGIVANVLVLHAIRLRGILLRNTSVILTHLITTDLICCLFVLPQHFAFFCVYIVSFPQARKLFKACSILENTMIFLNCVLNMVLSVERHSTATYIGRRRGRHLSKAVMICLAVVWLAGLGVATITYYTFKDSNQLPWKLQGQAASASSRLPSAGTVLALSVVFVATLTILISLHRMKRFLRQINTDANESFQGFSKREAKRRKMQKRITSSCLASLVTLAVSYLPLVTIWLLWYGLGIQNSNTNAIARVLCSLAHTINPLIATALSSRLQSAFVRILKSFYPFRTLLKRHPSFMDSITSFTSQSMQASGRMNLNLEDIGIMKNNLPDVVVIISECSKDVSSQGVEEESKQVHRSVAIPSATAWDRHISDKEPSKQVLRVKKQPLCRKRSSSVGDPRTNKLIIITTFWTYHRKKA